MTDTSKVWIPAKQIVEQSDVSAPQYELVSNHIGNAIASGFLKANEKLPSERTLGELLELSRPVVRDVLSHLEADGLIYRSDRRGWFVSAPRLAYDPSKSIGFQEYAKAQGRTPFTKVVSIERQEADQHIAENLNVAVGDQVFLVKRMRGVDGRNILVEWLYANAELCPDLDQKDLNGSYTKLIQKDYGYYPSQHQLKIHPTILKQDTARLLQVASGTSGLHVSRISKDEQGRVLEFDEEFWRHDSVEISLAVTN